MLFDTHAHYDDSAFDADRDSLLDALPGQGVALVLNPGCTLASSRAALALAERHPQVWAAVGLHPEDCHGCGAAELSALEALLDHPKCVAVGEIGLDYHWAENPPKEQQAAVFRAQLELARGRDKPVIVHDRDAHGDCLATVLDYPGLRGVFHCFSGSREMAETLLARGWYLGFDGPITYKNARKALEVLAVTPMDRILLETASPSLPPVPHRGERNDSRLLTHVAEVAARVKGVTPEELAQQALENGKRLFGIP